MSRCYSFLPPLPLTDILCLYGPTCRPRQRRAPLRPAPGGAPRGDGTVRVDGDGGGGAAAGGHRAVAAVAVQVGAQPEVTAG